MWGAIINFIVEHRVIIGTSLITIGIGASVAHVITRERRYAAATKRILQKDYNNECNEINKKAFEKKMELYKYFKSREETIDNVVKNSGDRPIFTVENIFWKGYAFWDPQLILKIPVPPYVPNESDIKLNYNTTLISGEEILNKLNEEDYAKFSRAGLDSFILNFESFNFLLIDNISFNLFLNFFFIIFFFLLNLQ